MSDNLLIKSIKEGDNEALYKVYETNKSPFYKFCFKYYILSYEQVEDTYHDIIIEFRDTCVNGQLSELKTATIKTYLFGMAKNKIRNEFRKNKYKEVPVQNNVITAPPVNDGVDDVALLVRHILRSHKLGKRCTQVLVCYYFFKMSLSEIMEHFNFDKVNTVSQAKGRCLGQLRGMINKK
jgi:RNA polymerase sigma factor (sigma-70 family)